MSLHRKFTQIVIDLFMAGTFLYYLVIAWNYYPFSLGGTLIFAVFMGIAAYYANRFKPFAFEISLFSLIPFLLMGLNFLAYIENKNGFSIVVMLGSLSITLLLHWLMMSLAVRPFIVKEGDNLVRDKTDFIKKIAYLFSQSAFILIPFLIVTAALFLVMKDTNNIIIEKRILSFTAFCLFWLLISLIYNLLILLKKRKYFNQYFANTIPRKAGVSTNRIYLLIVSILIIGSGFEMERGYWFLWLMSWATLFVLILLEWGTWQFVFLNIDHPMPSMSMEEIDNILSVRGFLPDSGISFKKFVILFLTVLSYAFILLMVASYFRMRE